MTTIQVVKQRKRLKVIDVLWESQHQHILFKVSPKRVKLDPRMLKFYSNKGDYVKKYKDDLANIENFMAWKSVRYSFRSQSFKEVSAVNLYTKNTDKLLVLMYPVSVRQEDTSRVVTDFDMYYWVDTGATATVIERFPSA